LSASSTCPASDACVYKWDLNNDGIYTDATGQTPNFTWFPVGGPYNLAVQVTDNDGHNVTASSTVNISNATNTLSLLTGWNLASFNLHPTNTDIATLLTPLGSNFTLVYAWDATGSGSWKKYDPSAPAYSNTLSALDETKGFWIKMNSAGSLAVSGAAAGTSNLSLLVGWNLVGYPSTASLTLPNAFGAHGVGPDFGLVYSYRTSDSSPWKKFDLTAPSYANTLSTVAPGYGYWIKVGVAHTWSTSY
jgi:hypothetical protein